MITGGHRLRQAVGGLLTIAFVFAQSIPALAVDDDPYWDKGRSQSTNVGRTNIDRSTFVISAHAFYLPAQGWGRERIRVWGRNDTIRNLYPEPNYIVSGVNEANLRFMVDCSRETRCSTLQITGTDPGPSERKTELSRVLFDILGYKGVPTSTLEAIVNGLWASRNRDEGLGYDWTLTMRAGALSAFDPAISSLPNDIAYDDADGRVTDQDSGLSVKFTYNLNPAHSRFRVWPQGTVEYLVWSQSCFEYCTWAPFYVPSGAAGVDHYINNP